MIIAIVDSGLDSGHPAFWDRGNHCCIDAYWDQTAGAGETLGLPGPIFQEAAFGRVYRASDFDNRRLKTTDELGHGTAVASIALGRDFGVARASRLVFVQIPEEANSQYSIMPAIRFIDSIATSTKTPAVINLSIGFRPGREAEFSSLDDYMTSILDRGSPSWIKSITVAAGNYNYDQRFSYPNYQNNLLHVRKKDEGSFSLDISCRSTPSVLDDHCQIEILFLQNCSCALSIFPPGAVAGDGTQEYFVESDSLKLFETEYGVVRVENQSSKNRRSLITLEDGRRGMLREGRWMVRLEGTEGVWDAFITSIKPEDKTKCFPESDHSNTHKLATMASSDLVITVGSSNCFPQESEIDLSFEQIKATKRHFKQDRLVSVFSSEGPSRQPTTWPKPEIFACGAYQKVAFAKNVYDMEPPEGRLPWTMPIEENSEYVFACGTSFSAPYVAGVIACMISESGCNKISPRALKEILLTTCDTMDSSRNLLINRRQAIQAAKRWAQESCSTVSVSQ